VARSRESPSDFTRQRSLPFPTLVLFLMNLLKSAIQYELDTFYAQLLGREVPQREVSGAAFTQARRRLKYEAFIELNDRATQAFYAGAPIRRWHGFRVLAIDGTTLRLPNVERIRKSFPTDPGEVPQGRLVELYDALNHIVLGAQFSQLEIGEGYLAECLLPRAQPGDVVLYDRGFPSFYLLALHAAQGVDYCMRVPLGRFKAVREFAAAGAAEQWVDIAPCAKARKDCLRNGLATSPLRVRLIRIELPGDEVEVLMTSLGGAIECREFAELYHLRWGLEEAYKLQKSRGELENFSGKTVRALYQDLHAKLLTMNLAAMCQFAADDQAQQSATDRQHTYRINRSKTLSKVKYHLVCALLNLQDRLYRLLGWIAEDIDAVRPGRSYPRRNPGQKKPGFHSAYKRSA
jgi:hypothetical protein